MRGEGARRDSEGEKNGSIKSESTKLKGQGTREGDSFLIWFRGGERKENFGDAGKFPVYSLHPAKGMIFYKNSLLMFLAI